MVNDIDLEKSFTDEVTADRKGGLSFPGVVTAEIRPPTIEDLAVLTPLERMQEYLPVTLSDSDVPTTILTGPNTEAENIKFLFHTALASWAFWFPEDQLRLLYPDLSDDLQTARGRLYLEKREWLAKQLKADNERESPVLYIGVTNSDNLSSKIEGRRLDLQLTPAEMPLIFDDMVAAFPYGAINLEVALASEEEIPNYDLRDRMEAHYENKDRTFVIKNPTTDHRYLHAPIYAEKSTFVMVVGSMSPEKEGFKDDIREVNLYFQKFD